MTEQNLLKKKIYTKLPCTMLLRSSIEFKVQLCRDRSLKFDWPRTEHFFKQTKMVELLWTFLWKVETIDLEQSASRSSVMASIVAAPSGCTWLKVLLMKEGDLIFAWTPENNYSKARWCDATAAISLHSEEGRWSLKRDWMKYLLGPFVGFITDDLTWLRSITQIITSLFNYHFFLLKLLATQLG